MFSLLGGSVLLIVFIVLSVCQIWILIEAFGESVIWGLLCLFFPIVSLIFILMHWNRVSTPVLLSLLCLPFALIGSLMLGMG